MKYRAPGVVFVAIATMTHNLATAEPMEKVQAGILSQPGRMAVHNSPNFALYLEVELAAGPEPRKPANVDIWSTPAWVYEPFPEHSKHKLAPNRLNQLTGCRHSEELFDQFHDGPYGNRGKNDFSEMWPLAIRCDQGQFLFLLLKNRDIGRRFLRSQDDYDWLSRQLKLVWWASREEMIPLEDLPGMERPRDIIAAKLRARLLEK